MVAASVVQAQNLVVNPGFETGDFTGWTVSGPNSSVEPRVGHTGIYAASFGAISPDVDNLSQFLATKIGQQYIVSFFAQTPVFNIQPGHPNALSLYFGGSLVTGPITISDGATYTQYSYTVTANAASSKLLFVVSNDADFTQLDDISVVSTVPEPGTLALLMGTSVTGAGFLARRRQRARQAV